MSTWQSIFERLEVDLCTIGRQFLRRRRLRCDVLTLKETSVGKLLLIFKWAILGLFPFIFGLFQTNNANFTANNCEKCPSSVWCRDSN